MNKFCLILVTSICFSNFVNAQVKSDLKKSTFQLLIENTKDGIKLTSKQGCAFKELTFLLKEGQTQEIDQFGMRGASDKVKAINDDDLASFCFTITKIRSGTALEVTLGGIEGVAWKKLSFGIPSGRQWIDQNGMM